MNRVERKYIRQQQKDFEIALKNRARKTGWRFSGGVVFRSQSDWFLSNRPSVKLGGGVQNHLLVKPMELDTLFWNIVGLEENETLPLSFRENGAWVLRPSRLSEFKGGNVTDPIELAEIAFDWTENWRLSKLPSYEIDDMINALSPLEDSKGHLRSVAICLLIMLEKYKEAEFLCDTKRSDYGGFSVGVTESFYSMAKKWLAKNEPVA